MNWFKLYYMMVDFNVGILLVYLPVIMRSNFGYNEVQIGQLYLWGGIVAIIGSIISGMIAQKISDERKVIQVGAVMMLCGIIAISQLQTFAIVFIIFTLLFFMRSTIYVVADELIINYINEHPAESIEFGKIRSFGSLGWGLNFLINGFIVSYSPKLLMYTWLLAAILLLISSCKVPHASMKTETEKFSISKLSSLFNNRNFMLFIICNGLFWGTINNMQTYSQFFVQDLGGTLTVYGIMNSLILIIDFMVMNNSTKVHNLLGNKKYYRFITILLLVKYFIIMVAFNPIFIYISILIDPFFFGLMIPFTSKYIKQIINPNLSTVALSLEKVMAQSAAAIGSIIFGYFYANYGGQIVFAIMLCVVIIIAIISSFINFENEIK